MAMLSKWISHNNFKSLLLIVTLCFISCNDSKKESKDDYSIDFTVKYNNQTNSFLINADGNSIVLVKEIYIEDKLYRIKFDNKEMKHIRSALDDLNINDCDTIDKSYSDGTHYIFYLNKNGRKKQLVSGTCEELKPLDKLVSYIIGAYRKKQKEECFESLETMTPPELPKKVSN